MPSKLKKAIGAVKDQTSISLAKVTNAANLEVIILKATTHDEIPIEERYIDEIVSLVSSSKVYAAACAQSIGRRIGKTKNWVVALKSLMIVLRIFQDGDPYFPREVFHAMKRGARILNLSGFRDDSSSSPWDYTAFVRTIALYLDERLDCFLTGKLQRRITLKNRTPFKNQKNKKPFNETGIKDMKPSMLLDRISYWQRLLDRAVGTKPTGVAKTNRLIQISLYAVVQETFDLYRDISDGLAVVLDSFFKMPCTGCLSAFQACVKSCKQFDELSNFYAFCKNIGVGRTSEYPTVQKISEELMEALQEFLKDQAANSNNNNNDAQSSPSPSTLSKHLLVSALRESVGVTYNSGQDEWSKRHGTPERYYETRSEYTSSSQCTSLEDLMSATDAGILTPRRSIDIDYGEQDEKQLQNNDEVSSAYESCSNHSHPIDQTARSSLDLANLDEVQNEGEKEKPRINNSNGSKDCWEFVLVETATTTPERTSPNCNVVNNLFGQPNSVTHLHYNPFLELEDTATIAPPTFTTDQNQAGFLDFFDEEPAFQATRTVAVTPAFCANRDPSEATSMAPTFTAQRSSFETDLASSFGDSNSSTLCAMPPTSRSQDTAGNNMALVPAFQNKNLDEMNSAPTFNSHGLFKISSASSFEDYNSCQTSTGAKFNSQGLFKISSAPSFNSQDSLKFSSASTFQDHNSYQTSKAPTFDIQDSFKIGPSSTFQGHNSYQTSAAPTFYSQCSFKISSASTSQGLDSHQTRMPPTFHDHNSYQTSTETTFQGLTSTTPTFHSHNSYQMSRELTFHDNNLYQTNAEQTFQSHNSYQTSKEPAFQSHNSYKVSTKPTFQGNNSYQMSTEPTFQRHSSIQTSTAPPSHGHSSFQPSTEPTFHAYNSCQTSTTPTFDGLASSQTSKELTFHAHNSFQTSTAPSFHVRNSYQTSTAPTPTFTTQNVNLSIVEAAPSPAAKNSNEAMVPSTFWGQNFKDTMATPTFCAKISNETMLGSPKEDDPFGPWPSSLTNNEHALNKSMEEQSLVQQQKMWLEQQNKIIAKQMT